MLVGVFTAALVLSTFGGLTGPPPAHATPAPPPMPRPVIPGTPGTPATPDMPSLPSLPSQPSQPSHHATGPAPAPEPAPGKGKGTEPGKGPGKDPSPGKSPAPAGKPGGDKTDDASRVPAGSSWTRPVTMRNVRVSQRYGVKGNWAAGHHTGIDLAVPTGTPVHSVGSGTVVFAGSAGAYGKAVTIRMTDGKYTLFAHMSRISVKPGKRVHAGTVLGRSGNTGRSTGPHLHFEVRAKRGYGSDIDPVRYLAGHGVRLP